ncbi:dUTP diphosphatase [Vagococcus lutrae]|uniref:dUTP diphosphatase n=1 Tax=Vagococcus lutrae TaxID=81947 RepID=UPI00288F46E5|nr:dUTP diphosphatase [Vagococcus lutrae]MDT2842631.1 dUTP diphosphatase [Vagococcus lutrae]
MNFKKLQEMQRALDDAILKEKPEMTAEERFEKTCVALSVEIAELANTAEHFKFWKENKGKVDEKRFWTEDGVSYYDKLEESEIDYDKAQKLTLVEEASDCLHFILSLANQNRHEIEMFGIHFSYEEEDDSSKEENLLFLNYLIGCLGQSEANLEMLLDIFFIYIRQLGITTQELEQAYYDKNEVNYQRLEQGY